MRNRFVLLFLSTFLLSTLSVDAFAGDQELAKKLTTFYRSARAVVSQKKKMILDPASAGLTVESFLKKAKKNYKKSEGKALDESDEATQALVAAVSLVVTKALAGEYKSKWASAVFKNKFLPARFAREVSEEFNAKMAGKMYIRLTTSPGLLVNTANKADSWEQNVIDTKFATGEKFPVFETANYNGKSAYRYILPEFYKASCLKCHGGAMGEKLHPSKKPGQLNSVGGAISFVHVH